MVGWAQMAQHSGMVIRLFSAGLWFVALGWASNIAGAFTGLSADFGIGLAAVFALFIATDPGRLLFPRGAKPVVASPSRIPELARAAQLSR